MAALEQALLDYLAAHPGASRESIRQHAAIQGSDTTVWRALRHLIGQNKVSTSGRGKATVYQLAGSAVVRAFLQTPYIQRKPIGYNREFLDQYIPEKTFYLPASDRETLRKRGTPITATPAGTYAHRILEKLLVDLSWASSRMEGNTYSLLDTERLIQLGQEATGKDRKESVMILNHKEAIQYVVDNIFSISTSRTDLLNIHALLSDGLLIDPAMVGRLRRLGVGIGQSSYKPLDDQQAIEEEFAILVAKASQIRDPFEQSFFLLVHIPYLQAFEDVNKRTSRIAANIPLLKADLAPMSFLTMNDRDYIDGLIGVYELNNVSLLREAYIEAYLASAENYRVLRAEVEAPEKVALLYRDFVKDAIRHVVLDWKALNLDNLRKLASDAKVPESDWPALIAYVEQQFRGLHEGNVIRYRLRPADLEGIDRQSDTSNAGQHN